MEENHTGTEEEYNQKPQQQPANQSSGLAVASMILAIFSVVLCMGALAGIPAIICGHIARGKAKRGEAGGAGIALAALTTAYFGTLIVSLIASLLVSRLVIAMEAGVFFPGMNKDALKISCSRDLKQIGIALQLYSSVYDDQYPHLDGAAGLEMLRLNNFLTNPKIYVCPSTDTKHAAYGQPLTEATVDYQYFGGHTEADSPHTVLACDKDHNHDKYGNVLYIDGHVKGFAGLDWKQATGKRRLIFDRPGWGQ